MAQHLQEHLPGLEPLDLPFPDQFAPENLIATAERVDIAYASEFAGDLIGYPKQSMETRREIADRASELAQPVIEGMEAEIDALRQELAMLEQRKNRVKMLLSGLRNAANTHDPSWLPKVTGYRSPIAPDYESSYYTKQDS